MKNKRNQRGFTLAELLIVVAIIGILAGVSFVAVQTHQEGLNQVELDTIAKEIFVAAQNHLSMAWNEGYLGLTDTDFGTLGTEVTPDGEQDEYYDKTADKQGKTGESRGVYYFSVQDLSDYPDTAGNIHSLILPPYALENTVAGGNFLIRYQPSTGLVLDVFYTARTGKYAKPLPTYGQLMAMRWDGKKADRRSAHVGWYGGTGAASLPQGVTLEAPVLEVENGDRLVAWIKDNNQSATQYTVALLVTGKISRAQQVFKVLEVGQKEEEDEDPPAIANRIDKITDIKRPVTMWHSVILDAVTEPGMHFAEMTSANGSEFIPGEDIVLRAVAYNMDAISNIANSDEKIVNSLFEKADKADEKASAWLPVTAYINNIRHLENLDKGISGVNYSPASAGPDLEDLGGEKPVLAQAIQTTDLEWGKTGSIFTKGGEGAKIYKNGAKADEGGPAGCFLPVNMPGEYTAELKKKSKTVTVKSSISYDGQHHSIKGITVNVTDDASAGLFGDLPNNSSVKDLALIDFNITSASGSAGALAGTLTQNGGSAKDSDDNAIPNVSNVAAYNTGKAATETITTAGDAGGLIGKVIGGEDDGGTSQTCTAWIEKSAAALVVSSTGADKGAGGLIGAMEGGVVSGCYSGGHTIDKEDSSNNVIGVVYDSANYNVTGAATAGGLIGDAGDTAISYSYSTCSVKGNHAGGLVGNADAAGAINTCYSTGLVSGSGKDPVIGAFAVLANGATVENCMYYQIINELATVKRGDDVMTVQMAGIETGDVLQSIQYMPPAMEILDDDSVVVSTIDFDAIDESADSYNSFVGAPDGTPGWKASLPYNMTLANYYQVDKASKYNLRTVSGLVGLKLATGPVAPTVKEITDETSVKDFVATHYGDWPAPEIFVANSK